MDYEKKYKKSLALMGDCIPDEDGYVHVRPQDIFPELKESEDERIKKEIISFIQDDIDEINLKVSGDYDDRDEDDIAYQNWCKKAIAWLENIPYTIDHEKREGFHLGYKAGLEKQGEQKPFDYEHATIQQKDFSPKEPKFKEGQWVIYMGTIAKILDLQKHCYVGKDINDKDFVVSYCNEHLMRLWTIEDACEGDVLVIAKDGENLECIFIFKDITGRKVLEYCYLITEYNRFEPTGRFIGFRDDIYQPATKEQRDTLFAKMKEAGYEWDENNKMLKEIVEDEEEPQNYKNQIMSEITDLVKDYIKQKPAWSEAGEDMKEALRTEYEKGRADAFAEIREKWDDSKKKRQEVISFLESLRLKED